jgi:hypothetical protein
LPFQVRFLSLFEIIDLIDQKKRLRTCRGEGYKLQGIYQFTKGRNMNPNDPNLKDDSNKPLESSENGAEKPVYPKEASQDSSSKEEPPKREAEQKNET